MLKEAMKNPKLYILTNTKFMWQWSFWCSVDDASTPDSPNNNNNRRKNEPTPSAPPLYQDGMYSFWILVSMILNIVIESEFCMVNGSPQPLRRPPPSSFSPAPLRYTTPTTSTSTTPSTSASTTPNSSPYPLRAPHPPATPPPDRNRPPPSVVTQANTSQSILTTITTSLSHWLFGEKQVWNS